MRCLLSVLWATVAACAVPALAPEALSQAYPTRPVRIISPFAAGGSNDVIARIVAQKLTESSGQQFIVDNRAGAGGVTGTEVGARATPDGYTLTMVTVATLAISPALRPIPYDPVKDFAPIGLVGVSPYVVLVNPTVPVRTIKELVALAKARPGQLEFGSGGVGTPGHLAGEMLKTMTAIKMTHIPYKAGSLALNDLLGGHISLTFSTTITSTHLIKSGRVRALAATSGKRIPAFPEIPTVAESGVPGYEFVLWLGLAAPAGAPDAIDRAAPERRAREDIADEGNAGTIGSSVGGNAEQHAPGVCGKDQARHRHLRQNREGFRRARRLASGAPVACWRGAGQNIICAPTRRLKPLHL